MSLSCMLPCTRVCADAHFRPIVIRYTGFALERVTTGVEGGEEDERPSKGGECSEADCHWQYCVGVTGLLFLA